MTSSVCVRAIATATAPHTVAQSQARAFAKGFFSSDFKALDRLLPAFDNTGIATRQLARPIAWYAEPHTFAEKNRVYRDVALEMAVDAAQQALAGATTGLSTPRSALRAIVLVSTTGVSTPSLDASVVTQLDLPRSIARVPVWGLGCAGGAAGLARASALAKGLDGPVLLIATEVCSATFVHGDRSKSNLIATALFADGAAAVIVEPNASVTDAPRFELLDVHSHLIDDSQDVMGWDLVGEGLKVRFSRDIPAIVHQVIPGFATDIAAKSGATVADLEHFIVHPGGAKVLKAYAEALNVPDDRLDLARDVLRDHGNMSSPTVLFVLAATIAKVRPQRALGLVIGLGPGFSAEGIIVRW